jgi:phage shock protein PspC (stress-responsive transcriptional regulator)
MLGVCHNLGEKTGVPVLIFQILFVIWFVNTGWALFWYFIFSLILDKK